MFVDLYNEGLIYKDKRLVNWDPEFQSAISDLEVEMVRRGSFLDAAIPEKPFDARRWQGARPQSVGHFIIPLSAGARDEPDKDYIVVATTRPETMLGDTAVAVHPEDERYKALIGKKVCCRWSAARSRSWPTSTPTPRRARAR